MTIIADALSKAVSYDVTEPIDPSVKSIHRDLEPNCDCPYPTALAPVAEVQTITAGDRTGGTMDITISVSIAGTLYTYTELAVAWNATASALQALLDAGLASVIPNYAAGDIAVTGGPFGSGGSDTLLTFSGDSVLGTDPVLTVIVGTSLTGGTTDPTPSETTPGEPARFWFAALKQTNVIVGTDPAFGAAPAGQYSLSGIKYDNYPRKQTIVALIKEATIREGQDWISELYPLLGYELPF